jgi:hypothetical protein
VASKLLKGNKSKLSQVETLTDSYRSKSLSATDFVTKLETCVGKASLAQVVLAIVEDIPEKDLKPKLRDAYLAKSKKK